MDELVVDQIHDLLGPCGRDRVLVVTTIDDVEEQLCDSTEMASIETHGDTIVRRETRLRLQIRPGDLWTI